MLNLFGIVFVVSLISCEDTVPLRENDTKISEDAPGLPGYLDETNESVAEGQGATISINRTKLILASGTTNEDVEVRLRTLKSIPEREEVASLGAAKGDVVEVVMYDKNSEEIFTSSVLKQPYVISQTLTDVSDEANLQYVVISAPGTKDEKIQTLSRRAITISTALLGVELSVSIDSAGTDTIFYAVESDSVATSVVVLNSGAEASNESGGTVTASSSSSSSSSSSTSSSGGTSIDCSDKGVEADGKGWIAVPANAAVGQPEDFCVMKYEASENVDGKADSRPGGQPSGQRLAKPKPSQNAPASALATPSSQTRRGRPSPAISKRPKALLGPISTGAGEISLERAHLTWVIRTGIPECLALVGS